jgi:hypothetical protein
MDLQYPQKALCDLNTSFRVWHGHSSKHTPPPPAICAVHNFIHIHDEDEIDEFASDLHDQEQDPEEFYGELAVGPAVCAEKEWVEIRWDNIAQAMWESYQELVHDGIYNRAE